MCCRRQGQVCIRDRNRAGTVNGADKRASNKFGWGVGGIDRSEEVCVDEVIDGEPRLNGQQADKEAAKSAGTAVDGRASRIADGAE